MSNLLPALIKPDDCALKLPVMAEIIVKFSTLSERKCFYDNVVKRGWFRSTLKAGGAKLVLSSVNMRYFVKRGYYCVRIGGIADIVYK